MKIPRHYIILKPNESFTCEDWHLPVSKTQQAHQYIPECLIMMVINGRGMRFVGDSVERFQNGDFVLLGPNVPNCWLEDESQEQCRFITSTFSEDMLGPQFLGLPELAPIRHLLSLAHRGAAFSPKVYRELAPDMIRMAQSTGYDRLSLLLSILHRLASMPLRLLASEGFSLALNDLEADRLTSVCKYIQESYEGNIRRSAAAKLAGMTPNAFSRFFRQHMGRTFKTYVTEIRIGQACHKLIEEDSTIARIAYDTGFNSLSNFNAAFRQLKLKSPREFRRLNAHTQGAPG